MLWCRETVPAQKVRSWHDPAHVLVGIFASRQPKPFGAFLTHPGLRGEMESIAVGSDTQNPAMVQ
jgi:hypothetical protein